jgi:hypothetical protein
MQITRKCNRKIENTTTDEQDYQKAHSISKSWLLILKTVRAAIFGTSRAKQLSDTIIFLTLNHDTNGHFSVPRNLISRQPINFLLDILS